MSKNCSYEIAHPNLHGSGISLFSSSSFFLFIAAYEVPKRLILETIIGNLVRSTATHHHHVGESYL